MSRSGTRVITGAALTTIVSIVAIILWIVRPGRDGSHDDTATSTSLERGFPVISDVVGSRPERESFKEGNRDLAAQQERERLARKNKELEDALRQAEQRSDFLGDLAMKLANAGELEMAQTDAEAAVLAGQVHRAGSDFAVRWGGNAPSEDSPEFPLYTEERDALLSDLAGVIKSIEEFWGGDLASSPESVAQFQSLQMYGALELSDANWQELDGAMQQYYDEGFGNGLNASARPESGLEEWEVQRKELSQRAFRQIQAILPAEKRTNFERLYEPDYFLWTFSIGGL